MDFISEEGMLIVISPNFLQHSCKCPLFPPMVKLNGFDNQLFIRSLPMFSFIYMKLVCPTGYSNSVFI